MSAALDTLRVYAPELASVADATLETLITNVSGHIYASDFGGRATEAIARLAAHEQTLIARDAAAGVGNAGSGEVTSLRAGDLSVNYGGSGVAAEDFSEAYYKQTRHGTAFLAIRDSRKNFGAMVAG